MQTMYLGREVLNGVNAGPALTGIVQPTPGVGDGGLETEIPINVGAAELGISTSTSTSLAPMSGTMASPESDEPIPTHITANGVAVESNPSASPAPGALGDGSVHQPGGPTQPQGYLNTQYD